MNVLGRRGRGAGLGVEMGFLKSERILTQDIPMHRAHNGHLGNVRHMLWHDLERK